MKNIISAAFVMAILSTPAFAEKTPLKPIMSECEVRQQMQQMYDEKVVVDHLDQIEMLLEEMRQNVLREYPKPTYDMKKAG